MHIVAIGGSDAGISAALRAREADPGAEVTVVVADAYPNFSICGIPYYVSGEVTHWRNLAHRSYADLEAAGMRLRLDTTARKVDVARHSVQLTGPDGAEDPMPYDQLVIGTGAVPVRPPVAGLDGLGPADGVHLLHSMDDTFAVMRTLEETGTGSAVIVGAGYVGLEMAEALSARGLAVTQLERLPEVLPTVDAGLGALVRAQLEGHGVTVHAGTDVTRITRAEAGAPERLRVDAVTSAGNPVTVHVGLVLVVTGVRPETDLAVSAGARLGARGAIQVDKAMRTGLPDVYAAGDCVITHHRLLGETYLPLGTTAHKQGRVAGENAAGGQREFAGSLGTQVVKVFDQAAARTGLRDHEAVAAGFDPVTVAFEADDHKAYYPGSHKIAMRFTGDRATGRLLGVQLFGHRHAEVAKRIDIAATAIYHGMTVDEVSDLDLSYTPPLGSPWDAVQLGAQAWTREQAARRRSALLPGKDGVDGDHALQRHHAERVERETVVAAVDRNIGVERHLAVVTGDGGAEGDRAGGAAHRETAGHSDAVAGRGDLVNGEGDVRVVSGEKEVFRAQVVVAPLVLGVDGRGGHRERSGDLPGRGDRPRPAHLAEDTLDRDHAPHALGSEPDLRPDRVKGPRPGEPSLAQRRKRCRLS
jgi:NADPH-dependent 2,4-dienoyl-CoA reductase/sulfur reductase-like enzyme